MGAIIVTGIPGVGKTTVMEAAAKSAGIPVVVYGSVMFEVANEKKLVANRDEMRKLAPATQREIQLEAASRMAKMGDIIVDTHCTVKTPKGFLPGLPAWVLERLQPTMVVLVEATNEEISGRRTADATRKRDDDSIEAIGEHQETNRRFAASYCTLTGATLVKVMNHNNGLEAAIANMTKVISQ